MREFLVLFVTPIAVILSLIIAFAIWADSASCSSRCRRDLMGPDARLPSDLGWSGDARVCGSRHVYRQAAGVR